MSSAFSTRIFIIFSTLAIQLIAANESISINAPAESKLQDDLQSRYLWPVRPVRKCTDRLDVFLRYKLIRIVELNLKEQTFSLNVQIDLEWTDYKLKWHPEEYGGISQIVLPLGKIWVPDLDLHNTSISFELKSKSIMVHSNGLVIWRPLAIIKSFCPIQVQYYPFDIQSCKLTFGSWTYDGYELWLTLKDLPEKDRESHNFTIPVGMDLTQYYPSTEWELVSLPLQLVLRYWLNVGPEPYPYSTFTITLRRHYKFYLMNMVLPLVGLSYLCLLVFYLPAESGEKITLCMSLLTSQLMFLVLMIDNIPVTSLAVPLLGKVIMFNMFLLFFSILCTTIVLQVHHRKPSTHRLPNWVKNLERHTKLLALLRLQNPLELQPNKSKVFPENFKIAGKRGDEISQLCSESFREIFSVDAGKYQQRWTRAVTNVCAVREHMARKMEEEAECDHWKFFATVIDRVFFILFHIVYALYLGFVFMDAPALYDKRQAVDTLR